MAEIARSTSREEILKESGPPAILGQGPNVWIIGSSYVRREEERARHSMGSNLGLNCHVWWFGKGGLRWRNLLPFFYQSLRGRTVPDVLLIHCGGNDLGNIKGVERVIAMKQDLLSLSDNFSEMKIILSSINERCHWRKANPGKLNKAGLRADDTTVIGQITDGDETAYREEVENLTSWCQDNNLHLNVSKTKELIVDYRK
ncbi:hypothetical protein OYC64_020217 [Pagothenia borchgrevinki]|uniref:SGNH hydrolase-type esterase domain-containing protein n=1 Tax=Pagothenia borchgrevinki TaxID=8213 RepID=A0ABD2FMT4_PAGBO